MLASHGYSCMSSIPFSVSTHHNPFCQGGWQNNTQHRTAECPVEKATTSSSEDTGVPSSLSAVWPTTPTMTTTYTTFRFIPSTPGPSMVPGGISCVVVNPNSRIVYTITSESPDLTVVRDSHRRSVALIESTSTPSVDIRGNNGKKPVKEWLTQDHMNPQVFSLAIFYFFELNL